MGEVQWYSWGSGGAGLLGHGNLDDYHTPTLLNIPPFTSSTSSSCPPAVTSLACSGVYSLLCTAEGHVYHCGDLLQSTSTAQAEEASHVSRLRSPTRLSFPHAVVSVVCGWSHSGCLTADGRLFMWGDNRRGQLGLPSQRDSTSPSPAVLLDFVSHPTLVSLPAPVTAVACGWRHSLALLADGSLMGWGVGRQGQLSDCLPSATSASFQSFCAPTVLPTPSLPPSSHIRAVACGWTFSLLLSSDGLVFACGSNQWNQCAASRTVRTVSQWQRVDGLPRVVEVACGWSHSLARDEAGEVWTWGRRSMGQAGDGRPNEPNGAGLVQRVVVGEGVKVAAVRCGSESCMAVDSDGGLWGWGWNEHGNLGKVDGGESSAGCVWTPRLLQVGGVEDGKRRRVIDVMAGGASVFARVEVESTSGIL